MVKEVAGKNATEEAVDKGTLGEGVAGVEESPLPAVVVRPKLENIVASATVVEFIGAEIVPVPTLSPSLFKIKV